MADCMNATQQVSLLNSPACVDLAPKPLCESKTSFIESVKNLSGLRYPLIFQMADESSFFRIKP